MHKNLRLIAIIGFFMALIIIMGLTPIGLLHVGPIYVTLLCIPVIVGTILLGTKVGIILAIAFGSVSLFVGLKAPSLLEMPIMQANLLYLIVLCYIPRLMIPLVTNFVHKSLLKKHPEQLRLTIAALAGSLTNTFLYLGFVLLFYVLIGLDHITLLGTLGTIVLFAGIPEAIAAALVSMPIVLAIRKSGLSKGLL
jgi:uncharacterized membrane protein